MPLQSLALHNLFQQVFLLSLAKPTTRLKESILPDLLKPNESSFDCFVHRHYKSNLGFKAITAHSPLFHSPAIQSAAFSKPFRGEMTLIIQAFPGDAQKWNLIGHPPNLLKYLQMAAVSIYRE